MKDLDYSANSLANAVSAFGIAGWIAITLALAVFLGSYAAAAAAPFLTYTLIKLKSDDEYIEALSLKVAALELHYAMLREARS